MKTKFYQLIGLLFLFLAVSPPAHAGETVNIIDVKNDATMNTSADPALASFYVVDPALESFKSIVSFRFEGEPKDGASMLDWSKVGLEIAFKDCSGQAADSGHTLRIKFAEGAFSKAGSNLYVADPAHIDVKVVRRDGRIRSLNHQFYSLKARIVDPTANGGEYLAELAWDRGISPGDLPFPSSVVASLKVKDSETTASSTLLACTASAAQRP